MREKRDWRKRRPMRTLTPDKLAEILRNTAGEKEASSIFKHLTGEEIPKKEKE